MKGVHIEDVLIEDALIKTPVIRTLSIVFMFLNMDVRVKDALDMAVHYRVQNETQKQTQTSQHAGSWAAKQSKNKNQPHKV